jgi:hypothetical protein
MAALSPREIDLAEFHDALTPLELIPIEDLGFFALGKSGDAVEADATSRALNANSLIRRSHAAQAASRERLVCYAEPRCLRL